MTATLLEEFVSSEAGMRRFQQERAISAVTGLIRQAMDEQGIKRSELASRLGKSAGWVTQLLDGEANKTIRTVADVLAVLGEEMKITLRPIQIGPQEPRHLKIYGGAWSEPQSSWQSPVSALKVKVSQV